MGILRAQGLIESTAILARPLSLPLNRASLLKVACMSILNILYQLFIGPLELFFEVVFSLSNRIVDNPGLSIVVLSLAMNFLVLPLYRRADAMQAEERDRSLRMKPWVDHIKKTFTGDERFMMLQTYYRQNNYKQTDALKGSVSLLLEIPFFIAAFHFLSNLSLLNGVSFGPIANLGAPDAMIAVNGMSINLLPLLMTTINVVSAAIYMKGFPLSSKVQMYGIAAIFLILLYNSPAGLVFYWTLNNVFSLVKNIFYKLKNPKVVLSALASAVGIAGLVLVLFVYPLATTGLQATAIVFMLLLQIPLIAYFSKKKPCPEHIRPFEEKENGRSFLYCCIFLALLTGLLIPSAVVAASPLEFIDATNFKSPVWYVMNSLLLATGTFVAWFGIFYRLATPSGKRILTVALWIVAGMAVVNYMFFGTGYGNLSPLLQFDTEPSASGIDKLANIAVIAVLAVGMYFIWRKNNRVVRVVSLALCLTITGMSAMNIAGINREVSDAQSAIEAMPHDEPHFALSKTGKNVIVFMLDRAASQYLPAIMNEKPELIEAFSGFTYYPNAVSFGSATNVGSPGLYGGYEYTPENMNARPESSLQEKHDEALKVMPVLFDQNGYDVTVCDPSYAGYSIIPDLSIYKDYPGISAYITMDGHYGVEEFDLASNAELAEAARMRNFFCYGIFKIAPLFLQPTLYNSGAYNAADAITVQKRYGSSVSEGVDSAFMNAFGVLQNLPAITEIADSNTDTFLMMSNDTTHEPMLLSEPDYQPAWSVDNTLYDAEHEKRYDAEGSYVVLSDESQMIHYHANVASLRELGTWFDYLRQNDVFDNTRIIIVSDHGWTLGQDPNMIVWSGEPGAAGSTPFDTSVFNCMLLVKDFDSTEPLKVDDAFMTNADTPALAVAGLIEAPANPFTGQTLDESGKQAPELHLQYAEYWQVNENNGNVFLPGHWFALTGDMHDNSSWAYLGDY